MKGSISVRRIINKAVSAVTAGIIMLSCGICRPASEAAAEDFADYQTMADEMVVLVNEARAEAGLKPLYAVPVLNAAGMLRAEEISGSFSHNRPGNMPFYTVIDDNIYYNAAAENIAAGNKLPSATFNQWLNSDGHRKNMLNEKYTHIGVGVCYAPGSDYGWYWEQIFISSETVLDGQYIPSEEKLVPISCGDIDGDGEVTVFDLVLLRMKLEGKVELNSAQLESADCIMDGVITSADAAALSHYLTGRYDTLPYKI